jgi:hypothetical protein
VVGRKGYVGTICHVDHSHGVSGRLVWHKDVLLWGRTGRGVIWLGIVIFGLFVRVMVSRGSRGGGGWARVVLGSLLLCSNFFRSEKATAWAPWATHGMFMARFVKIGLRRDGETVEI